MRVLLLADMEGISQITTFRELWPEYPDDWERGKEAMVRDAAAAVKGLRSGGATTLTLCELHGHPDTPIIDLDKLSPEVEWLSNDVFLANQNLARDYDALFHLGWHARCGTANGFMSHTNGLNVRVSIDGKAVTEVHINGWRTGLPLIGVTGDKSLGPQLDGVLDGVPFLAVKEAQNRFEATPLYDDIASAAAIEAFAEWSIANASEREPLPIPERFVLALSMPPALADQIDGVHGLRRTSPAVLAKSCTDWWYDAEPPLAAAMSASFRTLIDPATDQAEREHILERWATEPEPEWLT